MLLDFKDHPVKTNIIFNLIDYILYTFLQRHRKDVSNFDRQAG